MPAAFSITLDGNGLPVRGTNGLPVAYAGGTGTDYSVNAALVPIAGLVLLTTVPVLATRTHVEVQNQSGASIQLVRDDGAGANQTSIMLGTGGPGAQGGMWGSYTFKGRVRVYGLLGSQVSACQE